MLNDYLAYLAAEGRSPATLAAYTSDLIDIDPTFNGLRAHVVGLARAGFRASTLARKLSAARSYCRWLEERGAVLGDWPRLLAAPDSRGPRRPPPLAPEDVARLIDAPHGHEPPALRDRAMLRVLADVGCRASELLALDEVHVDLSAGYLRVGDDALGTSGFERVVPLDPETAAALASYLQNGRPRLHAGLTPALFLNQRGERLTRQGLWLVLRGHAARAGVAVKSPSQLRHAAADRMLALATDPKDAQYILGFQRVEALLAYRSPRRTRPAA